MGDDQSQWMGAQPHAPRANDGHTAPQRHRKPTTSWPIPTARVNRPKRLVDPSNLFRVHNGIGNLETASPRCLDASLDFDGEYGRTYRKSIQDSIPGHDVLHEIARAAIQATASDAQQVLVVGQARR